MTSTLPTTAHTVPNTGLAIRRADSAWRKEHADDPAPADYLAALVRTVDSVIVQPLLAGAQPAEPPADPEQLKQLTEENTTLRRTVAKLTREAKGHAGTVAELDQTQGALAEARRDNAAHETTTTELQAQLAEARAEIERLTVEAAAMRDAPCEEHVYPRIEGTDDAEPCKGCGREFPPTALRNALAALRNAPATTPPKDADETAS